MSETALSPVEAVAAPAEPSEADKQAKVAEFFGTKTPSPLDAPADEPAAETAEAGEAKTEDQPKKEKTPEEREIARLRRRVDSLTKRYYQAQQGGQQPQNDQGLQRQPIAVDNQQQQVDSERLSLSRAELQQLIQAEAGRLAPAIKEQQAEIEHRRAVVTDLAKTWGQERFDALASDLDDAFGGLADQSGRAKPAAEAIFESENPAALIEYLADPDNAAEAETLSKLPTVRAVAKVMALSAKLAAEKAQEKPKRSTAAAPLESTRGQGTVTGMPDPRNIKAYIKWANEQERKGG